MPNARDHVATARTIIDANLYMVLATADQAGRPWASPVYYAPAAYREFLWVSRPEAKHSRNLSARSEVSIVIFDSSVPIGTGGGVYMSAVAQELAADEQAEGIAIFSRRSLAHGGTNGRSRTCACRPHLACTRRPRWSTSSSEKTTDGCR